MANASLRIPDLIIKKRNGGVLTPEEINHFVTEVVNGGVQECQLGKFNVRFVIPLQ